MEKQQALAKWAAVYKTYMTKIGAAVISIDQAVAYGVQDMINQTKRMSEADAAYMINDDADWMVEKMS